MEAYFDNSATTRCFDEVKDIVCKTMTGDFGNPSAMHKKGMEAENYVRKSAQTLAKLLKVNEKEILVLSRVVVIYYNCNSVHCYYCCLETKCCLCILEFT